MHSCPESEPCASVTETRPISSSSHQVWSPFVSNLTVIRVWASNWSHPLYSRSRWSCRWWGGCDGGGGGIGFFLSVWHFPDKHKLLSLRAEAEYSNPILSYIKKLQWSATLKPLSKLGKRNIVHINAIIYTPTVSYINILILNLCG